MVERQHLMGSRGRPWRRALLAAIVVMVVAVHAWVGHRFNETMAQWHRQEAPMQAVDVVVSGALRPEAPVRKRRAAPPPVETLSTEMPPEDPVPQAVAATEAASNTVPLAAAPQGPPADAAVTAPEPSADKPAPAIPVDPWPPSTRIRYTLKGNFRGDFHGSAQVLWLRDGDRYRVELDVVIGPKAAPLMSRRVSSEGRLSPAGLVPRRYEEETRVIFARTRRVSMVFEPGVAGQNGTTIMGDGTRRPAPPGTQDSASQFVQLAWLFGTQATPVKSGDRVSFPLALSRRSDVWTYSVGDPQTVDTPAGPVEALHARPQREMDPLRRELIAEVWFAPTLQYLPVRMRVSVDAETHATMVMDGLPELVTQGLPPPNPADRLPTNTDGAAVPAPPANPANPANPASPSAGPSTP